MMVKDVTRLNSSTCIDHILLMKTEINSYEVKVTEESIADHFSIDLYIKLNIKIDEKNATKNYYVESEQNKVTYLNKLRDLSWDSLEALDLDSGVKYLVDSINKCYVESFPLVSRQFNKRKDPRTKWMTRDLLDKRETLRKLGIKAKTKGGVSIQIFNAENKIYKNEIKKAKNKQIRDEISKSGRDGKKLWDVINNHVIGKQQNEKINSININGITITNEKLIAEEFSNHFKTAANNLHNQINVDPDKHKDFLGERKPLWEFVEVTEAEVLKTINNLLPKHSKGIDGISNKLLKMSKFQLLKPITTLFNRSLRTGIFPSHLKVAKVIPIFKKGDKADVNNYRPISLLPTLSKIWEKLINTQLQEKMDEYDVIINDQYGFRKQHSTINAVQKLVFEVNKSKRLKKVVCGVFIDVSKAFDSCKHDIIINKLENIGLSTNSRMLLKDYLKNRTQIVNIGDGSSNSMKIEHGVGQGTILGPLLFKLYIADMVRCTNLKVIHFADDTTFICSANNKSELVRLVNTELVKINSWFEANYLTLHPDKSRLMVFGSDTDVNITLNNKILTKCGSLHNEKYFNMLGIRVDQKLNWNEHISHVNAKISKGIYLLWRFKNVLEKKTKLMIYHAFIRSHLLYGISLWGNMRGEEIRKLTTNHKKAIRGLSYGKIHTEPILKQLKILNLQDEVKLEMTKMAWLYVQDRLPQGIRESLNIAREDRQLRYNRNLVIPINMGSQGKFQIDVQLPLVVNRLGMELTVYHNITAVKNKIKNTMISNYNEVIVCNNMGCIECLVV